MTARDNKRPRARPETELAIAVRRDSGSDAPPPRITAAGRGALARQILELAWANGVKVREDADLAEALSALELDSEIPLEALAAVCEILRYVYQANAAPAGARSAP